ncbi:MAG: hypothetical protein NZ895_06465 [Archaeoglobaceae archaeon]|nr:hypothetical protein [Archaeoglobaceae archaeon]MCX8152302.1 hypothetical protein [Archaeoglobaceae archaeon]MDW8013980.1 hypothetical protein [Archaeoglobaceae archaeon]
MSKGVSEVVGALTVILLIVSVAGILYIMSYPIISDSEEAIKYRKAYFDLLEINEKIENVGSGLQYNSTYTLRISGLSFNFENEPIFILNNRSLRVSSIKVFGNGWEILYENGAIIERRISYSKLLHYPSIYYDREKDVLTLPIVKFSGAQAIGGKGHVTLNFKLNNVERGYLSNCTMKIISSNPNIWKNLLNDIGISNVTVSGKEVTFTVSRLEFTIYEVQVL